MDGRRRGTLHRSEGFFAALSVGVARAVADAERTRLRDVSREVFVSEANEWLEGRAKRVLRWFVERSETNLVRAKL